MEPDPIDEMIDQTACRFETPKPAGYHAAPHRASSRRETTRTLAALQKQVQELTQQLAKERALNQRLLALNDFGQELDSAPDPERTAQSMAKILSRLMNCDLVVIFQYLPAEQRFKPLASAGASAYLVPGNFPPDLKIPAIRPAVEGQQWIIRGRLTSTAALSADAPAASGPLQLGSQPFPSLIAAPLMRRGQVRGFILLADSAEEVFNPADFQIVETAAAHLLNAWDYAQQNDTLTEFVQIVARMSVIQETGSLLEMIASIARRTLNASYAVVAMLNQQEWMMRGSGQAPEIYHSLQNGAGAFLEEAVKCPYTFRLRDLRKDKRSAVIHLDTPELRTLLASPITINGAPAGILLAFGKNDAPAFSDGDVFLAELLVSQASVNLESCYLNQELRANLKTTQLLYDLSLSISQAESLTAAAYAIGKTAYRLLQARNCGLILFSPDGRTEAEVRFPTDDAELNHPYGLVQQAMDSRQTIYLSETEQTSKIAIPIQTQRRCYGALWMELPDDVEESYHPTEEIRILINQAAVALERSILLEETRAQVREIAVVNRRLEESYEDLLYGLTKALDARDQETKGHSKRVMELSEQVGIEMGLSRIELQSLKRGALLHDIGKIGISDLILLKKGPLDNTEWQKMRQHPQIGAKIIQDIPALHDALPVIAFHQERWDGSGYPLHLKGTNIPLLARIFAVVDVYDALTSDRPYRKAMAIEEALEYLQNQAGIHFDPEIVARFTRMIRASHSADITQDSSPTAPRA